MQSDGSKSNVATKVSSNFGRKFSSNSINRLSDNSKDHELASSVARKKPIRITAEQFISETTSIERDAIATGLSDAVAHFIKQHRAVYLSGFGILIPRRHTQSFQHQINDHVIIREETHRVLVFEKTNELVPYHQQRFGKIIESKELCEWIYPRLNLKIQLLHDPDDFKRLLRGFIANIKREVIVEGFSNNLPELGTFFATHHRQGTSFSDWFAGADIWIKPSWREVLSVGQHRAFERPELKNAWELLEAGFDVPLKIFTINLLEELNTLGYDSEAIRKNLSEHERTLKVAVFGKRVHDSKEVSELIYCTDGLRTLGINSEFGTKFGNEFVFQHRLNESKGEICRSPQIPKWPARALTAAWLLLNSTQKKSVKAGTGLSCGAPIIKGAKAAIETVFTTNFALAPAPQRVEGGEFQLLNIIGISAEEAELAAKISPEYLLEVLEHRKLSQCGSGSRATLSRAQQDSKLLKLSRQNMVSGAA